MLDTLEKDVFKEFLLQYPIKSLLKLNSAQVRATLEDYFSEQGLKYLSSQFDEIMNYASNATMELSKRFKNGVLI